MTSLVLYWNQKLHQEEMSANQITEATNHPYLSFLHGCLFDVPEDLAIAPAMRNGAYEFFELNHLRKMVKAGDTFIDIGACVGVYSIIMSKIIGDQGRVYSFEPYDTCYLYNNLRLNNCRNTTVFNYALSDKHGYTHIVVEDINFGNTITNINSTSSRKVYCDTLDNTFKNINLSKTIIKMDAQGDEFKIIQGGVDIIRKSSLLIEVSPFHLKQQGYDYKDLIHLLVDECHFDLYLFAPNTFYQNQNQVVMNHGYTKVKFDKSKFIDLLDTELETNKEAFINVWCSK